MGMVYLIGAPCVDVKDRSCVDECPVECIYEGDRMLYIHPDECIDCGACEAVCPTNAVVAVKPDLDPEWVFFKDVSRSMFDKLGRLGGSYRLTENLDDPEEIRDLETRQSV
jgi:NAD-dependent dihydropyrimidine dehydrogenase PreA subunit